MSKTFNLSTAPSMADEATAFMAKMRRAAMSGVTEGDVAEIVKAQVVKAKSGDQKAIDFVMDKLIGGLGMQGATINQELHYHAATGEQIVAEASKPLPLDQRERAERIRARLDAGLDPVLPNDLDDRDAFGDGLARGRS